MTDSSFNDVEVMQTSGSHCRWVVGDGVAVHFLQLAEESDRLR